MNNSLPLTEVGTQVTIAKGAPLCGYFHLATLCCVVAAVYQIVNFYLGYKVHQRIGQSRANTSHEIKAAEGIAGRMSAADTTPFFNRASVTENITELLEPVPRKTKRNRS